MDKYEFGLSVEEIDRLIEERRFQEAAAIADTIDWTKVRGTFLLCRISDLYKINKRYKDSRDLLEIAYDRKPSSSKIIYSLCELELKLNNYIHALQLYNAFTNVAPRDPDRYLLQYKLYKKQDVNVLEQITVLEEFLRRDFRERWAYELAELYLKAGDEQSCISQCDEIVAYFGDGRFVIRALELKQSLTRLTPQQEERLEILKSGGTVPPPVPKQETEGESDGPGEESTEAGTDSGAESDTDSGLKADAEADTDPGLKADAEADTDPGLKADAEADTDSALKADAEAEEKTAAPAGTGKGFKPAEENIAAPAKPGKGSKKSAPAEEETAPPAASADLYEDADSSEPSGTPEEYTDVLLRDAKMQETIARGMREIDGYDSVLAQETSGQLAMVIEEEPLDDPQVERQLDLEQIMSEWEKIRKESEQQRLAQARRRVIEQSDAVKRELYGDDFANRPAGAGKSDGSEDSDDGGDKAGDTRSWDPEDVKKRTRKK